METGDSILLPLVADDLHLRDFDARRVAEGLVRDQCKTRELNATRVRNPDTLGFVIVQFQAKQSPPRRRTCSRNMLIPVQIDDVMVKVVADIQVAVIVEVLSIGALPSL
jgi:hypothetical protein